MTFLCMRRGNCLFLPCHWLHSGSEKKIDAHQPPTKSLIIFSIWCSVGKFAWQQQQHQHCSRFTVAIMRLNGKWKITMNAHDNECIWYPVPSIFLLFDVRVWWFRYYHPRITSRCSTHSWKCMKMINLPHIRKTKCQSVLHKCQKYEPTAIEIRIETVSTNVDELGCVFWKLL